MTECHLHITSFYVLLTYLKLYIVKILRANNEHNSRDYFFFCIKISRECKYLHVTSICLNESHFTATTSAPYLNNPYIRARQSQIAEIRTRSTSWNREIFPRGKFSTTVVMDPRPLPAGPQARKR